MRARESERERERERGQSKPTLLGYRFEQSKTIKIMFSGCFIEKHGQIEIGQLNSKHGASCFPFSKCYRERNPPRQKWELY